MDLKVMLIVKFFKLLDVFIVVCSESVFRYFYGNLIRWYIFFLKRNIFWNGSFDIENCFKMFFVVVMISKLNKCEICCIIFYIKDEWIKYFDEIYYGYIGEFLCNIKRLFR